MSRASKGRRWVPWGGLAGLALALWLVLPSEALAADPLGSVGGDGDAPGRSLNLWPVYDERDDPVDRMHVRSGLGPLLTRSQSPDSAVETAGLRPLFHWTKDTRPERLEWEFLYPLMTYSRVEEDAKLQLLQLLNIRLEGSDPQARENRTELFPVYVSGTTETGQGYLVILPFGGWAPNWFWQDEAEFVLFPLYARFVKQGAETWHFPWPILSVTRGEDRSGFRFVPLYGQDVKEGVFEKRFVLWPLFFQQRSGLDGDDPEETLAFLPFYVSRRSKSRDETSVLWPFFSFTQDRERHFREWQIPWPLIRFARGEGRTVNQFLPFFATEQRVVRDQAFLREMQRDNLLVLFPLYVRTREEFPGSLKGRDRILLWLYSDQWEEGQEGSARRVDAWPIFRYTRDREGRVEFQTLALLEAFMPGNDRFERNYSPLWALYTYRRNPAGDSARSFLWNLVRHEETGGGWSIEVLGPVLAYRERGAETRLSVLGGLFEYAVSQGTRSVRLFGRVAFSWTETPQPMASLDPAGGVR
jgi:hypothetical protein